MGAGGKGEVEKEKSERAKAQRAYDGEMYRKGR